MLRGWESTRLTLSIGSMNDVIECCPDVWQNSCNASFFCFKMPCRYALLVQDARDMYRPRCLHGSNVGQNTAPTRVDADIWDGVGNVLLDQTVQGVCQPDNISRAAWHGCMALDLLINASIQSHCAPNT